MKIRINMSNFHINIISSVFAGVKMHKRPLERPRGVPTAKRARPRSLFTYSRNPANLASSSSSASSRQDPCSSFGGGYLDQPTIKVAFPNRFVDEVLKCANLDPNAILTLKIFFIAANNRVVILNITYPVFIKS